MASVMSSHILLQKANYIVNCKIIAVENYTSLSGSKGSVLIPRAAITPQTRRLKAAEIYSLIVLEAWSPKSRHQQSHASFEIVDRIILYFFIFYFLALMASVSSWCSLDYRHIIPVSTSIFVWSFFPYIFTLSIYKVAQMVKNLPAI